MCVVPIRANAAKRPSEFRRLRSASVLAEVFHFLCAQEFILVLAGRVFHEDGHGVGFLVEQVTSHVLRSVFLLPSAQAHDVSHGIFALVQEHVVEDLLPGGGLAEHISAIGHTGAQSVREEDAERSVRGKYVGESAAQPICGVASCAGAVQGFDQWLVAKTIAVRAGEI